VIFIEPKALRSVSKHGGVAMACVFGLQSPAVAQADGGSAQAAAAQGLRPLSELRGALEDFGLSYQLGLTGVIQSASETAGDRDTLASYSFDFSGWSKAGGRWARTATATCRATRGWARA